jgi:hypothetical protein
MERTSARGTLVGVFETRDRAERAVDALERAGFNAEQIGFMTHDGTAPAATGTDTNPAGGSVATGVIGGGALGGLLGAAASLLIPGVGPVIAGGILASTLMGAGLGAVAGGFIGVFAELGLSEHESSYYEGEYRAGRSLVTVKPGDRYDEAFDILRRHGAYDFATRPGAGPGATDTGLDRPSTETVL